MERDQVHTTLTRINQTFDDGEYESSLSMARELKRQLLREDGPIDPMDLGWVRFYEFKSLYELGDHGEAWDLLEQTEPRPYVLSVRNAAYMYSVGSELAMHLDRVDDVLRMGRKCLDLRLEDNDLVSAVQCAATVCELLRRMEQDGCNTEFARFLIEQGRATGAERPLMQGVQCLARNIEQSRDPALMREAAACVPFLERIENEPYLSEALPVIEAVTRSDWYADALKACLHA